MIASSIAWALVVGPLARSSGASSPAPNACAVLSAHEIQAVLGGTVADGTLTAAPDGTESICGWVITRRRARGDSAQLDIHAGRTASDFSLQRKIAQGRTRTVKQLGDGAFSERAVVGGQVYDDLWVRHGPINFRVEVLRDVGPKPLVALARLVLTRL